jgi:hypothetical protein
MSAPVPPRSVAMPDADPVWNEGTPMPLDYTCHCGLYVHPERKKHGAIHISDCPYAGTDGRTP